MSSSNQRPANRGFRSVLRCAISHYRQVPSLSAPEPPIGCVATLIKRQESDGSVEAAPAILDTNVGLIDTYGLACGDGATAPPVRDGSAGPSARLSCGPPPGRARRGVLRHRGTGAPAHGAKNPLGLALSPLKDRRADCLFHDLFSLQAAAGHNCNTILRADQFPSRQKTSQHLIVSQFEVRLTPSSLMSRAKLIIFLNSV